MSNPYPLPTLPPGATDVVVNLTYRIPSSPNGRKPAPEAASEPAAPAVHPLRNPKLAWSQPDESGTVPLPHGVKVHREHLKCLTLDDLLRWDREIVGRRALAKNLKREIAARRKRGAGR